MSNQVRKHPPFKLRPLITTVPNGTTEKVTKEVSVDVRMCKDCQTTVFSRRDFAAALAEKPPDLRAFENLIQFERGIKFMLPKFQRLLVALQ